MPFSGFGSEPQSMAVEETEKEEDERRKGEGGRERIRRKGRTGWRKEV